MTLYNLLVDKLTDNTAKALSCICKDRDKFNEYYGRARMCDELIKMLSDNTLKTEVITRIAAITKGENDENPL